MTVKRWWVSDTHFGHKAILRYCPNRKYATVADMDADIIRIWNEHIAPEDVVYHLGDFGLCSAGRMRQIIAQLNGSIRLQLGNHDHKSKNWYKDAGFVYAKYTHGSTLMHNGAQVTISHYPLQPNLWERVKMLFKEPHHLGLIKKMLPWHEGWHLCGHVHNCWKQKGKQINVGWDVWGRPVEEEELLAIIRRG